MRTVIVEHELTNVPLTLCNPNGSLVNGIVGKSSAVDDVIKTLPTLNLLLKFHMTFLFVMLWMACLF